MTTRWLARLTLLATAVGLVLMHHLAGGHAHGAGDGMTMAAPAVAVHPAAGPGCDAGADLTAPSHPCLAVLTAAAALSLLAPAAAVLSGTPRAPRPLRSATPAVARPPPLSRRLARLRVRRL